MRITYSGEDLPHDVTKTIFLAGPTQRIEQGERYDLSWRDEALKQLAALQYDGDVFVPLFRDAVENELREASEYNYTEVTAWEEAAMNRADVILFWVARYGDQVGLTTNVEFGRYLEKGTLWYGRPDDADNIRYLDYHTSKTKLPIYSKLSDMCEAIDKYLGEGMSRHGSECLIPLNIWKTNQFQTWYNNQVECNNQITKFNVKSVITTGNHKRPYDVFGFAAAVTINIGAEGRFKDNEWIISRSAISAILPYHTNADGVTSLFLTREYRSAVNNELSYVYEFASGSSHDWAKPINDAIEEAKEELGLEISNPDRLIQLKPRQAFSTMCTNLVHPYLLPLTGDEYARLHEMAESKEVTGSHYSEVITIVEVTELDLASKVPVDFTTLGMLYSAILKIKELNQDDPEMGVENNPFL